MINFTVPDSFVSINGYYTVRTNTMGIVPKHGVCFYIQDSIPFQTVHCDCQNVVVIHLFSFSMYLVLVYRPPSACTEENVKFLNLLVEFCMDKEVVIMRDFNLPEVNWSLHDCFYIIHRYPKCS